MRFNNLVNFLAPGEYFVDRTGELIGVSAVVDVVIVDGKVWAQPGPKCGIDGIGLGWQRHIWHALVDICRICRTIRTAVDFSNLQSTTKSPGQALGYGQQPCAPLPPSGLEGGGRTVARVSATDTRAWAQGIDSCWMDFFFIYCICSNNCNFYVYMIHIILCRYVCYVY